MLQMLRGAWGKWRESRRQYAIERALYKAGGGRGTRGEAFDKGVEAGIPPPVEGGIGTGGGG
jgi:hypothetical protein